MHQWPMPLAHKMHRPYFSLNRLFFQFYTQSMAAENYSNVIQNEGDDEKQGRAKRTWATDFVQRMRIAITWETPHTPSQHLRKVLPNRCKVDGVLLYYLSIEQTNHKYANRHFWSDLYSEAIFPLIRSRFLYRHKHTIRKHFKSNVYVHGLCGVSACFNRLTVTT